MKIEISSLYVDEQTQFDVLICAIGYETRSTFILSSLADKAKLIIGHVFLKPDVGSLEHNKALFEKFGGKIIDGSISLRDMVLEHFDEPAVKPSSIAIDVSSMTRTVMADFLSQLIDDPYFSGISISVIYSLAKFAEPSNSPANLIDFSPIRQFSGWTVQPEKPAAMILGLGYELDQAIGAIEYIDPSTTIIFSPVGKDPRFAISVAEANEPLFEIVAQPRVVRYDVDDPLGSYWYLHSLVGTLVNDARVIIVPMGPKIFVSLCLLCQREFGNEVSVWRSSSHSDESARDAHPDGLVIGYTFCRLDQDPIFSD